MKFYLILIMAFLAIPVAYAQNSFTAIVKDSKSNEPIAGAIINIVGTPIGSSTDAKGIVTLTGVPDGRIALKTASMGYAEKVDSLTFPLISADTLLIALELEGEEIEEVTVSSTRSTRTIQDIPTRVELIGGEELDEKANMKPGDIRMVLMESTGIQTLTTSPISGNANIRIQGLDGRYTQILKDGFPMYAGFSGGLGLLQTPPLDLKQVEIIKGSSSTLYGGGAIAGLINLISKAPSEERELRFLLNGTSAKGLDLNGFFSQRFGKAGVTVFAARNSNAAYSPKETDFTAIPKFERYTINPKLFLYPSENTDIVVGVNTILENRLGGDRRYIAGEADSLHTYFERNKTQRISTQLEARHRPNSSSQISLRNSFNSFKRIIELPGYTFDGIQASTFTEANYAIHKSSQEWIFGLNLFTDGFKERQATSIGLRDYSLATLGSFVQHTRNLTDKLILEGGVRGDYIIDYGLALLPRLSFLYRPNSRFSSRLGGGFGYKAPTIFTEESERISYRNVLPIHADSNKLERSIGGNWDVNYRTSLVGGKVSFSINQLFFFTRLNSPLVLTPINGSTYRFRNLEGHIDAQGAETNIKLGYRDFKLFLGYTLTYSNLHVVSGKEEVALTPRHRTNTVLMYEVEDKWKVGLEAYYYSPVRLSDGSTGRDYWLTGFMAEKLWERFSVFINFENLLDIRQTRFEGIYTGTVSNPMFRDIYAPLEGFIVNGGVKLRL